MCKSIKYILDSYSKSNTSINKKDIEFCLCYIIGKPKTFLISNPEFRITNNEIEKLQESIDYLKDGLPLAYIVGNQEFYGYTYFVNNDVLIPRPETEIIIPKIIEYGDAIFEKNKKLTLIDAGAGSGCIGLTIASERPRWKIILRL